MTDKKHPLTDADCKQILKDNPHVWEYGEDVTLLVNELMRAAYDVGYAQALEDVQDVITCIQRKDSPSIPITLNELKDL